MIRLAMLAFALGILAFHALPGAPAQWLARAFAGLSPLWLGLGAALLSWGLWRGSRSLRLVLLLGIGLCWALWDAGRFLAAEFPASLTRVPLVVEGRILSLPLDRGGSSRFIFAVERAWTAKGQAPIAWRGRVRLSWYAREDRPLPRLAVGERWRLPVRLKPRHGLANPGGFDYERWLVAQRIQATGTLRAGRDASPPERLDAGPGLRHWIDRTRQRFVEHLAGVLGEHRALGLIQGLTIGERGAIASEDWEAFRRTGTGHLIAISGLHIALIAGAALAVVGWLWARCEWLALALAAPRAAALAGLGVALLYAALAGFSLSTQRALVMLAVVLGARLWLRLLRPWQALGLALGAVLLLDPRAPLSAGFWLSFGAVAALVAGLAYRLPAPHAWQRLGRAQWVVTLGLLAPLLWLFGQISLIAPLVNLLAVPLFSLVLLPLVLLGALAALVPGLEPGLRWVADWLLWWLDALGWLAAHPWASATLPAPPLWGWGAALLGTALALAPRGLPGRWLGLVLLAPLVLVRPPQPPPGELWFSLLDVGQGLAAVARTAEGTLVFDTGPGFASGFNTGTAVIAPYLRHLGVSRIERLVISHADSDHAGGLRGLLAEIPVDRLLSGEPGALSVAPVEPCQAGAGWNWSGVSFRFLHPPAGHQLEGNAASCVLRIALGDEVILLTGDVGQGVELDLVERYGQALGATLLVAGHHGSATSSAAAFLDAVAPEWVLFAVGYANQFGFPAQVVRERLAERAIASLESAQTGTIEWRLRAQGERLGPWSWRARQGRWWSSGL
ncbi:MAG: DNA internalization-related competence protein ComEC/Rec2 [Chromatiaceae bacterium]|nr:DNA internalization-related competence protein ComEC/Rec2 [Chromatiaceae bacterium]